MANHEDRASEGLYAYEAPELVEEVWVLESDTVSEWEWLAKNSIFDDWRELFIFIAGATGDVLLDVFR